MKITFVPLAESHFPLLLKWLETPHVKNWWDQDVTYTLDLVKEKFGKHIHGLALSKNSNHKTYAYIICANKEMIGYIQAYNAHDFAQENGLNLNAISGSVCGVDLFIGEQPFLHKGCGVRILNEFEEQILAPHFDWCLIDPAKDNLTAVKAFTKAGFKIFEQFQTESTAWMLKDLSSRNDPLPTIQKLIKERYVQAKAIFWAGSVSEGRGTSASDLDLIIVFEEVAHAYREAFIYDGWPIDAFIHDLNTLRYFFEESRTGNGISGLCHMILNGREVTNPSTFSKNIKILAQEVLNAGPAIWDQEQINKERFLITDVLDDIKYPTGRDEQIASAAWLLEALGQFYFRSQNKWCASGKSIIRYLKSDNPDLALEFMQAFQGLFQTSNSAALELLVKKILDPYGGLFWNGFRSDAPKESRINEAGILPKSIEALERSLLDSSVRQSTEQLNKLIADDFLEFGSSGKVYNKHDCIKPDEYPRKFVVSDFKIKELSKDVTLATYKTTEDGIASLRSSIWQRYGDEWKMIFHQGTKCKVQNGHEE
ncbi:GNAT family N-acetyltransferase [Legionella sp. km772]|uniref:GNAT family N-acetyltransferase n=1 Tax=Legionella sp. km772 TaxID=2498111 RepID=UPI000F8E7C99|nr:GNAT family N-acetyltransferase [Legionella sp. km772]RUR14223.1 GNAT family N-acetyltransferase [Legionella sp. km772]